MICFYFKLQVAASATVENGSDLGCLHWNADIAATLGIGSLRIAIGKHRLGWHGHLKQERNWEKMLR